VSEGREETVEMEDVFVTVRSIHMITYRLMSLTCSDARRGDQVGELVEMERFVEVSARNLRMMKSVAGVDKGVG
jgi:hypothetical protein